MRESYDDKPGTEGCICEREVHLEGQPVKEILVCRTLKNLPQGQELHLCRTGLLDDLGKPDFRLPVIKTGKRTLKTANGLNLCVGTSSVTVWAVIELLTETKVSL